MYIYIRAHVSHLHLYLLIASCLHVCAMRGNCNVESRLAVGSGSHHAAILVSTPSKALCRAACMPSCNERRVSDVASGRTNTIMSFIAEYPLSFVPFYELRSLNIVLVTLLPFVVRLYLLCTPQRLRRVALFPPRSTSCEAGVSKISWVSKRTCNL